MRSPDFYAAAAALGERRAAKIRTDLKSRRPTAVEIDEAEMLAAVLEAGAAALRRNMGLLPILRLAPTPPLARPAKAEPPIDRWRKELKVLDRRLGQVMSKAKLDVLQAERAVLARNIRMVEQRDRLIESLLSDDKLLDELNVKIAVILTAPAEAVAA